jgi:hypothetical protein
MLGLWWGIVKDENGWMFASDFSTAASAKFVHEELLQL